LLRPDAAAETLQPIESCSASSGISRCSEHQKRFFEQLAEGPDRIATSLQGLTSRRRALHSPGRANEPRTLLTRDASWDYLRFRKDFEAE
jgi:hypothetical protein